MLPIAVEIGASHSTYMRYALIALVLVGCGSTLPPSDTTTEWSVTLGNWETPVCDGEMTLSPAPSLDTNVTKLSGTWKCGVFGHAASAQIFPDGRVFLDLESNPGNWNGVRGELADDAIVGDIRFDDKTQPFAAFRR